jgi:hypothetical protein
MNYEIPKIIKVVKLHFVLSALCFQVFIKEEASNLSSLPSVQVSPKVPMKIISPKFSRLVSKLKDELLSFVIVLGCWLFGFVCLFWGTNMTRIYCKEKEHNWASKDPPLGS